MLVDKGVNPFGVPIVDRGILGQCELLTVAVRPQVGRSFKAEPPAVLTSERDDLAMTTGCCCSLATGAELGKGFISEVFVVVPEECGT